MKINGINKLITQRRSIRTFNQQNVSLGIIKKAIDAARVAPSAANLQFLEYLVVTDKLKRKAIFPFTRWAGYLYPKKTPALGYRPTVYVIILANKRRSKYLDLRDVGAAVQNMMLLFSSCGVGSCWIGSLDKEKIRKILKIPSRFVIDSLIAAGYSDESPKLETDSRNVKYWLDQENRLHVPKRPLKDILHYGQIA